MEYTKIVINRCFGGFGLSRKSKRRYVELKGLDFQETEKGDILVNDDYGFFYELDRTDPILVQIVEEMGEKAGHIHSNLRVETIPKGTLYRITEYDGNETLEICDEIDWKIA